MRRVSITLLGLCLVSPVLVADESEMPDLAFIEFLGEWQDEGEAWLDTQELEELSEKPVPAIEVDDE